MNRNPEAEIVARNKIIAGLEKENKIQDKIIREQKRIIKTLEYQLSKLQKLLEQILKS